MLQILQKLLQKVREDAIIKEVKEIAENKLLELKNDLVFQELFGKQKNSEITGHLISLILERKVKNVNLDLNKRMLGDREDSKTGRLDIRARFNDGEECDIELQVVPYEQMEKRLLDYWAQMYISKISSGDAYSVLKPSIAILISNYKLPKLTQLTDYHTRWNLREKNHTDLVLTEDIEVHILEIPKIKKEEIDVDELALWLKFIQNPMNKEVRENMEKQENRFLKQAEEELAYLSGDEDFKRLVKAREGFLRDQYEFEIAGIRKGKTEGRAEGRAEGKREEKEEIARKMISKNMKIEDIIELTGLTKEELEKLKDNK